jgi:hypothetical protein
MRSATACRSYLGSLFHSTTMLCAGGPSATPAVCYGDSGGPLVARVGGTSMIVGLVSFLVVPRCGGGQPAVFSRVSSAAGFIAPYLDPDTAPNAPDTLTTTRVPRGVRLAWTPPTFDGGSVITGYRITVQPGGQVIETGPTARSHTVTGLVTDQQYSFTVQAQNALGLGTGRTTTRRAG